MAFQRKQFTFYVSYRDILKNLPKSRQLPTLWAVIDYALDGTEPELTGLVSPVAFLGIKPNVDASRAKAEQFLQARAKRAPGAEPGGRKKKDKKNKNDTDSEKEMETETENEGEYAPPGADSGAEPRAGDWLSPCLSERVSEDFGSEPLSEEDLQREAAQSQAYREAQEPYAAMLRQDPALERLWETYLQAGSDGQGPPSEAEKLVVLSVLSGLTPERRRSNLAERVRGRGEWLVAGG